MLVACAALAATDQQQSGRQNTEGRGGDRAKSQPPIQITVTTPDRSAEEKEADRERAQRQDATNNRIADANASIATLTFWLVIVGGIEVAAIAGGLIFTAKAANSARRSADTANTSLKLLNQPWLDTAGWKVEPSLGLPVPDGDGGHTQPIVALNVLFFVTNKSRTPANLKWIQMIDEIHAGPPEPIKRLSITKTTEPMNILLTPGSKYSHSEIYSIGPEHIEMYEKFGFIVDMSGTIHFSDVFTENKTNIDKVVGPRRRHVARRFWLAKNQVTRVHLMPGSERIEDDPESTKDGNE